MAKKRKKPLTTAQLKLVSEVSRKFAEYIKGKGWKKAKAARELGISRASMYNYLAKTDVPGLEVLKKAHVKWELSFDYVDFELDKEFFDRKEATRTKALQGVLPFIEAVREEHIDVLKVAPKKSGAVEVTIRIRFAG